MIRILIVDDSAFMRKVLTDLFKSQHDFEVVDIAKNGADAVEKVLRLSPDVVTMDIEMPVLDGLTALEKIMTLKPTPVIMVSSRTQAGTEATIKALSLGAVDFVTKNAGSISRIDDISVTLLQKCRDAKNIKRNLITSPSPEPAAVTSKEERLGFLRPLEPLNASDRVVAIGASTGGPRALQEVLTKLPANLSCPVIVVQHMPPGFTKSLAERLNALCEVVVKEAEDNDRLMAGTVYVAPGDYHTVVRREGSHCYIKLNQDPAISGLRPAVDPLMISISEIFGINSVGVILTGMGRDGVKGMQAIKQMRGKTIAEDQSTAVVFGMPKAVIEAEVVDNILPLPQVAAGILNCLKKEAFTHGR